MPWQILPTGPMEYVCLAFSRDSRRLFAGTTQGALYGWSVASSRLDRVYGQRYRPVWSLALTLNDTLLATGHHAGLVTLHHATTNRLIRQFVDARAGPRDGLAFTADSYLLATWTTGADLTLWRSSDGTRLQTVSDVAGGVGTALFPATGDSLILVGGDGQIYLRPLTADGHRSLVVGGPPTMAEECPPLTCSPDGRMLLTGDMAGHLRLWRLRDGHLLWRQQAQQGAITAVAFTSDGSYVVSGGTDGRVGIWGPTQGTLLRTYTTGGAAIVSLHVIPESHTILALAADGRVWRWGAAAGRLRPPSAVPPLRPHIGTPSSIAWAPSGRALGVVWELTTVSVWVEGSRPT